MVQHPSDNHYCSKCFNVNDSRLGNTDCLSCVYSTSTGFSHWKPMSFNGTTKEDLVNKPKHYVLRENLEVRDVLAMLVDKIRTGSDVPFWKDNSLFESDYVQMMQYLMRFMDKNGVEDLRKAEYYLTKLIEAYD